MARFTKNSVEGTPDEGRSGWLARREKARARRQGDAMKRAEIAAIRAAHYGQQQADAEQNFNPQAAGVHVIGNLSDADLIALYQQHLGRMPGKKAKRPAIERAVREAMAAAAAAQAVEIVGEDNTELTLDELAGGEDDSAEVDDV